MTLIKDIWCGGQLEGSGCKQFKSDKHFKIYIYNTLPNVSGNVGTFRLKRSSYKLTKCPVYCNTFLLKVKPHPSSSKDEL